MSNQVTELENYIVINGTAYKYAVDDIPQYQSSAFVTSGALYDVSSSLEEYSTRHVVDTTAMFVRNSTNIPTVGLVYTKINDIDVTGRITSESSDYSSTSTKIPTVGLMYSKIEALAARVTALENS